MQSASILILEHISTLARVYSLALQGMGYSVRTITDGQTALNYLNDHTPEVILLDAHLLGISSVELFTYIKSQRRFRNTKIILMSADLSTNQRLTNRADCVLEKPVRLRDMGAAIRGMSQPQPHFFPDISLA